MTEEDAIFMEEAEEEVEKQQVGEGEAGGGGGGAGRPGTPKGPVVDPLETVQWELQAMCAQADRAYLWLERRFGRVRRLHLASSFRIFLAFWSLPS